MNFKIIGAGILFIGLVLAAAVVVQLFILPPSLPQKTSIPESRLNTGVIDDLELWIEEVEDARRAGLKLPMQPTFVVEEIKIEERL